MGYIKQLDALRAFAIFFVLCVHWFKKGTIMYTIAKVVHGPDVFFAISGFLITTILIKERQRALENNSKNWRVFLIFFCKRALRIFPAYYLILLVAYFVDRTSVPSFAAYVGFIANFNLYHHQAWTSLSHLWSMSVEQQFYLIWPWIILLVPQKYFLHAIILFISIGMISQQLYSSEFRKLLPQNCFDTLGMGALLAWVVMYKFTLLKKFYKMLTLVAIISIILLIVHSFIKRFPFIIDHTLVAVIVIWLIAYFLLQQGKPESKSLFNHPWLLTIGKMSYGLYLYHLTLFSYSYKFLFPLNGFFRIPDIIQYNTYFLFAENLIILFCFSWLSLRFIELPIAKLKKHFRTVSVRQPFRQEKVVVS